MQHSVSQFFFPETQGKPCHVGVKTKDGYDLTTQYFWLSIETKKKKKKTCWFLHV